MKNGVHLQGFKGYFEGTKALVKKYHLQVKVFI